MHCTTMLKSRKDLHELHKSLIRYKVIDLIAVELDNILDNNSSFDRVLKCINFILVKDSQVKSSKGRKKCAETNCNL